MSQGSDDDAEVGDPRERGVVKWGLAGIWLQEDRVMAPFEPIELYTIGKERGLIVV